MKKLLFALSFFLFGALFTQIPDLIGLYEDHVIHGYQDTYCAKKKIGPDKCQFYMYFYPYVKDHPTLNKMHHYFQFSEGPLYFILSGRCSKETFHNPSAAPKDTGKITNRDYFYSRCSDFNMNVSDLIFKGTK
jgi:hypothetical protein